jgi:hypothetical protein
LLLGSLIITRGDDFLLNDLLGFRYGCARGRRYSISLDLLAAAPNGGLSGGRRSGLALGPTSAALRGRFGGRCGAGAGGLLLSLAGALGGRSAWRGLLFIFDIEL